jgi:hypothetical protein
MLKARRPPEPIKAPAEPAAVEAAPVKQPVTQIALQPTPPRDPDPLDQQARQMEIGAYITRHPSYKQEKLATQAAYEECIQEMSRHYDAPAEKVREEFLDPLLKSFQSGPITGRMVLAAGGADEGVLNHEAKNRGQMGAGTGTSSPPEQKSARAGRPL